MPQVQWRSTWAERQRRRQHKRAAAPHPVPRLKPSTAISLMVRWGGARGVRAAGGGEEALKKRVRGPGGEGRKAWQQAVAVRLHPTAGADNV